MRLDEACFTLVVLNTLGGTVGMVQHRMDLGWVAYIVELQNGLPDYNYIYTAVEVVLNMSAVAGVLVCSGRCLQDFGCH